MRPVVFVLLLAACGGTSDPVNPSYVVQYRLTKSAVTIDSMKYDNGHGALVKVIPVADTTNATFTITSPGSLEAFAWGTGAPGGSAKLKVTWTVSGISSEADSATVSTVSAAAFSLHLAHRTF